MSISSDAGPWRVAVVGAGISGLAAAHRLIEICSESKRPLDLTVFEAGSRVGGSIETQRIGDYLVETGADSFITNKPWAVSLCQRLGLENRLISTDERFRRALVLRNGRPVPIPDGFLLLAPAKVWPVLRSPIFSPAGKLRMALEYFVPRRTTDDDESLADFVRRRLGREAFERLVQPLVGGIYTSDPEKLSLHATMPRFVEMEREHRSLIRASRRHTMKQHESETQGSGARYGLFTALQDGLSERMEGLVRSIELSARIRMSSAVVSLATNSVTNQYVLDPEFGDRETFDAVILTVPAHRTADLLAELPRLDATERDDIAASDRTSLADLLRQIGHASTAVVVSGHKLADVQHPLDASGLVVPIIENREILAVSFTSRKFPGRAPDGHVLLRTFVGGAIQAELLERSDDEIIALVQHELRDILGVKGEPDFLNVLRFSRAMPQYHTGHNKRVSAIQRAVSGFPGLELAGNAFDGVGIPDCIHSGERAAENLFATEVI